MYTYVCIGNSAGCSGTPFRHLSTYLGTYVLAKLKQKRAEVVNDILSFCCSWYNVCGRCIPQLTVMFCSLKFTSIEIIAVFTMMATWFSDIE
jgi:hypothetical protein